MSYNAHNWHLWINSDGRIGIGPGVNFGMSFAQIAPHAPKEEILAYFEDAHEHGMPDDLLELVRLVIQ